MSKVISFSISDRYLDKLRTLYPDLTDNLAAKQFLTDGLDGSLDDALDDNLKTLIESSLGNSLDDVLDDMLDDKLKTIIETSLGNSLDATVGKLISDLSERMARLEERLDTNLDGGLDEMELLLRMKREASITSLIPPGEPSPFPTIGENPDIEPVATDESAIETVEAVTDTVEAVTDTVESVEPDSINEPGKSEGMNPNQAHEYLKKRGIEDISYYYLNKWAKEGLIPWRGKKIQEYLILSGGLYYPIDGSDKCF